MRTRLLTITSLTALLLAVFGGSSFAQDDYPPSPEPEEDEAEVLDVSVQKPAVAPGDINRFTVECPPDTQVRAVARDSEGSVFFDETATTGSSGEVTFEVRIPSDAPDGEATFTVTCGDDTEVLGFVIDSSLPITGGQLSIGMALAAVALLGGAGLVLVSRRRRRSVEVDPQ